MKGREKFITTAKMASLNRLLFSFFLFSLILVQKSGANPGSGNLISPKVYRMTERIEGTLRVVNGPPSVYKSSFSNKLSEDFMQYSAKFVSEVSSTNCTDQSFVYIRLTHSDYKVANSVSCLLCWYVEKHTV